MAPSSTLLTASDEAALRAALEALFAAETYRLVLAENGAEALALAAEVFPGLVLLDVMMPPPDGLEVCRRLCADPCLGGVPNVLITALADQATRLDGLDATRRRRALPELGHADSATPSTDLGPALGQRAETKFNAAESQIPAQMSPEETQHLLHELHVHPTELEMESEELRRTQADLEAARARYFDLCELAPVGYVTLSETGLILEANLAAAKLLGVARSVLVNQPLTSCILPEDQGVYYRHRRQLFDTGAPQTCDLRMMSPDGSAFWVQVAAATAQDSERAPICRAVIADVTERKETEAALRESECFANASLEALAEHIAILDETGLILKVNRAWRVFAREHGLALPDAGVGINYLAGYDTAQDNGYSFAEIGPKADRSGGR